MDMQSIESALQTARRYGDIMGEFEALQDIAIALSIRCHTIGDNIDQKFYRWYLERLIKLQEEITTRRNRNGPGYRLSMRQDTIMARIRATLAVIPEVVRQE